MNLLPHRVIARIVLLTISVCVFAGLDNAQETSPIVVVDHGPNSSKQQLKHYVILISFDGFRYDYAKRYNAKNLLAIASRGASAPDGMIPSFPSVTFPNHYTLVTGLYPEHHGIVGNVFYDPARKQVFSYRDRATVTDGTWYGGPPCGCLPKNKMRTASFFWPGSEADIQEVRPSYYAQFDDHFPNAARVKQVLDWLRLPAPNRPHFIALYFGDADRAGHEHGPESPEVSDAVHELDSELGALTGAIQELKLPVDVVVVSDHGMATTQGGWVSLNQYGLDVSLLHKFEDSFLYPNSETAAQQIFDSLEGSSEKFRVYRRPEVPSYLHFDLNPREGDPVIVATGPFDIRAVPDPSHPKPALGNHGFDPMTVPEMKATFIAAGPDIRPAVTVNPFENVDIYPLIARMLGLDITSLKTGPIDGSLAPLQTVLAVPKAEH